MGTQMSTDLYEKLRKEKKQHKNKINVNQNEESYNNNQYSPESPNLSPKNNLNNKELHLDINDHILKHYSNNNNNNLQYE